MGDKPHLLVQGVLEEDDVEVRAEDGVSLREVSARIRIAGRKPV